MATLERIRKRSGLLIVVIGVAMGGFVLQDLFSSGANLFSDPNTIGTIDGEKITRQDFSIRIENLKNSNEQYANLSDKTVSDYVWQQLLLEHIQGEQYDILGLTVTPEELFYEVKNQQEIRQAFPDPATGVFDEGRLGGYLQSLVEGRENGNAEAFAAWKQWTEYEKAIKVNALTTKYNTAIKYGIYMPTALGENEFVKNTQNVQAQFIRLAYADIVDSTVAISASDLKSYHSKNSADYEKTASRDINYVTFAIQPSDEDNQEVLDELHDMMQDQIIVGVGDVPNDTIFGFENTDNDSLFVSLNSDYPFSDQYIKTGQMPQEIDSLMMNSKVGYTYGPYKDGDGFTITKLNDILFAPDSVKARHILIAFAGAERANPSITRTGLEARALADSLYNVIKENPKAFESISQAYSDDIVAKGKGGDLGWFPENAMAGPFANYCFRNETGDIGFVNTNFGYHIIIIDGQEGENKSVRVANLHRAVYPSQITIETIYREAAMFAKNAQGADDYTALAEDEGYALRPATNITKGAENIPGLNQNREIVKWTFNEDRAEGDISVFSTNTAHIVVILENIFEEGVAPLDKVEDEVRAEVLKEKKAEILTAKINSAMADGITMDDLAAAVGGEVKPQATSMNGTALSGVGAEPEVIGTMMGINVGEVSKPIVGNSGVFVVLVQEELPFAPKENYNDEKNQLVESIRGLVASQVFESLKKDADIEDLHNDVY